MADVTLFTDNFNRADTVSGLGSDWYITRGSGGKITSNAVAWQPGNGHGSIVDETVVAFPADQWAQLTVVAGADNYMGVGVRIQDDPPIGSYEEQRGYFLWVNGNRRIVAWHRVGSSGEVALATVAGSGWSDGDVLYLSAVDEYTGDTFDGVRLVAKVNGVQILTALDNHAGAWRTGQPGYNNYYGSATNGFDNFSAGTFSSGYSLSVAPGTLNITGAGVDPKASRDVKVSASNLAFNNTSVGMSTARSLSTDPGILRIYPAGIDRILPVRSSSLNISNTNVSLTEVRQYPLPVDQGVFNFTGGAVSISPINVYNIPVDKGNLAFNATTLVTRAFRALQVTSANFGIGRQDVVVDRDRRLQMDAGHFQILRRSVFLRYSGAPDTGGPNGIVNPVIRDYNALPLIRDVI